MNNIEKHAKVWINNNWVNFKIKTGVHTNIVTFLDNNNLSFIKENPIDFNKIPLPIRGNGKSTNLLDYLSKNKNNMNLIHSFLFYFINSLDFRYENGNKIKIKVINNPDWKKSNIIVEPQYSNTLTVDSTMITVDSTLIVANSTITADSIV